MICPRCERELWQWYDDTEGRKWRCVCGNIYKEDDWEAMGEELVRRGKRERGNFQR